MSHEKRKEQLSIESRDIAVLRKLFGGQITERETRTLFLLRQELSKLNGEECSAVQAVLFQKNIADSADLLGSVIAKDLVNINRAIVAASDRSSKHRVGIAHGLSKKIKTLAVPPMVQWSMLAGLAINSLLLLLLLFRI